MIVSSCTRKEFLAVRKVPYTSLHCKKAMTLIELLASLAILGIILLPMYNILLAALRSWESGDTRAEASQNARVAMERMSTEIRQTKVIYTADTREYYFWTDRNRDTVEDTDEQIRYLWSGTPGDFLTRTQGTGAVESIAEYVQNFQIEYRDQDNIILSTPVGPQALRDTIRLTTINLTIKKDDRIIEMRVSLYPRNI